MNDRTDNLIPSGRDWVLRPQTLAECPNWQTIWENREYQLRLERTMVGTGPESHPLHRYLAGMSPDRRLEGAVCVCRVSQDDDRLIFVRSRRLGPEVELTELPRGAWAPGDIDAKATALRELREETGLEGAEAREIGVIFPDSGALGSRASVVLAVLDDARCIGANSTVCSDFETDGETEETLCLTSTQIQQGIAAGRIRDGITLSALYLAQTWIRSSGSAQEK